MPHCAYIVTVMNQRNLRSPAGNIHNFGIYTLDFSHLLTIHLRHVIVFTVIYKDVNKHFEQ